MDSNFEKSCPTFNMAAIAGFGCSCLMLILAIVFIVLFFMKEELNAKNCQAADETYCTETVPAAA